MDFLMNFTIIIYHEKPQRKFGMLFKKNTILKRLGCAKPQSETIC